MPLVRRLALVLLALAGLAGALSWWDAELPAADELRIVSRDGVESLDPRIDRLPASLTRRVAEALWDDLLEFDAANIRVLPGVARSWTITGDGKRIVFHLSPDSRWSNGEPVVAEDFVRQVQWQLSGGVSNSQLIRLLAAAGARDPEQPEAIAVRALDAHTLEVRCQHPPPDLLARFALGRWPPLHASTPAVFSAGAPPTPGALVTNGVFQLAAFGADEVRLTRNPWHPGALASDAPARLTLRFTESAWLYPTLIRSGQAHVADVFNFMDDQMRRASRGVSIRHENTASVSTLVFNTSRPPLNDARVRRALSLALDRAEIARKFHGGALPAYSFTPPVSPAEDLRTIGEDLAEARRLLAAAGYPEGRGFPVLRVPVVVDGFSNPLAFYCAEQWRQRLGLRVYVAPLAREEIVRRTESGDFDLMHYRWVSSPLDVSSIGGHLVAPFPRPFRLKPDPAVLRAFDRAEALDGPARRAAILDLERAIAHEVPATPVVLYHRYTLLSARVSGWSRDIFGRHSLAALSLTEKVTVE
jgi:oligopeptide transport system substrate-binding protein